LNKQGGKAAVVALQYQSIISSKKLIVLYYSLGV